MPDLVLTAVKGVTDTWIQEADKRRKISKADPDHSNGGLYQ